MDEIALIDVLNSKLCFLRIRTFKVVSEISQRHWASFVQKLIHIILILAKLIEDRIDCILDLLEQCYRGEFKAILHSKANIRFRHASLSLLGVKVQ